MPKKLLVCVTNYEFNKNALVLKNFFREQFETILIDSSTPGGCAEADIVIPNRYYPGLWDEAVIQAIRRRADWLLFIASDVELIHASLMHQCIREALEDSRIQVWTPSVAHHSRASFKSTFNRFSAGARLGGVAEGFCFMARTSLLREFYPAPKENVFGWHIDVITSMRAHEIGTVAVDDRVIIYHPPQKKEHQINSSAAFKIGAKHLHKAGFSEATLSRVRQIELHGSKGLTTPPLNKQRSLDLGCGIKPQDPFKTGNSSGVDLSNPNQSPAINIVDVATQKLPYPDSSFEYITAFDLLQYIPNAIYFNNKPRLCLVELMNEIYRVLKPGGIFASLTPAPSSAEAQDNTITSETFRQYFCSPENLALKKGFRGSFLHVHQSRRSNGKLLTLIRALKEHRPHQIDSRQIPATGPTILRSKNTILRNTPQLTLQT
tara:strand:- start:160 stop:1461 length:1302 start_codon:yes stop_codon:yes gene_type:complete